MTAPEADQGEAEHASDEALLVLYANGDSHAARELAERLLPRVLKYAARLLGDVAEAEDVAQETMLRLWRIAPDWRPGEAQVRTWVYRVATNLCADRMRRRWRGLPLEAAGDPADTAAAPVEAIMAADRAAALQAAIAALPERQRQAVVLRHLEGLDNPTIAAVMDTGVEAVESLIARGRRALSAALRGRRAELGFEDD